jgi:adhesin/invasin
LRGKKFAHLQCENKALQVVILRTSGTDANRSRRCGRSWHRAEDQSENAMRTSSLSLVARFAAMLTLGGVVTACSDDTHTASAITAVSGNNQTGTVAAGAGTPLVVLVKDEDGDPMSGVAVTFTTSGGATVGSTTATTDANGKASTTVTYGTTSGTQTVTATAAGVSTPIVFTLTANAAASAAVSVVSGNNQTGNAGSGLTSPLVVMVTDQYGNPVSGATIDWTTTGGTFAGTTQSTTASNGTVSGALQLPSTKGPVTVTATVHGTNQSTTFTATSM